MNYAKHLDRRALTVAVWAAEFTRALALSKDATIGAPHLYAAHAATNADHAVEALNLFLDVEFRLARHDELAACRSWEKFVAACRDGTLTDTSGHGELATDRHVSNVRIYPSETLNYAPPSWATRVRWYNK